MQYIDALILSWYYCCYKSRALAALGVSGTLGSMRTGLACGVACGVTCRNVRKCGHLGVLSCLPLTLFFHLPGAMGCGNSTAAGTASKPAPQGGASLQNGTAQEQMNVPYGQIMVDDAFQQLGLGEKLVSNGSMVVDQVNDNVQVLQSLNNVLFDRIKKYYVEINRSYSGSDYFRLWKAAHSLKGTTSSLRIMRFLAVCKAIEEGGKSLEAAVAAARAAVDTAAGDAPMEDDNQQKLEDERHKLGVYIELLARQKTASRQHYAPF